MQPLGREAYYGSSPEVPEGPRQEKLRQLRSKLHEKARNEPKFRFYALYDRVYRPDVLEAAWRQVGKRGKAAGLDGVRAETIMESEGGVERFLSQLHEELRTKRYRPSPVKRVYIPKADGSKRPLGIPVLKDRVVQMAVVLILEPIFEADFLDCSYGFRPGRGAHGALTEIGRHIKQGRTEVYDADLKGYFDSIPHAKLMAGVKTRVADRAVLALIEGWLKAPVVEEDQQGKRQPPRKSDQGTPQGGVISPLLANVHLHWFDRSFHGANGPYHWAGARLVRYADDFVVLARYQGEKLQEWIRSRLEDRLGLALNPVKTKIVRLTESKASLDFLGYTFRYQRDLGGGNWKYLNLAPSAASLRKARETIRAKTASNQCYRPAETLIEDLNGYLRGWREYFRIGYPACAYRQLNYFTLNRMITHLNRRSQRKYHRPKDQTHYQYLHQTLGLIRL